MEEQAASGEEWRCMKEPATHGGTSSAYHELYEGATWRNEQHMGEQHVDQEAAPNITLNIYTMMFISSTFLIKVTLSETFFTAELLVLLLILLLFILLLIALLMI